MTDIVPFSYEEFTVRTVLVDGEPWFVAADVAKVLDLQGTSAVTMMVKPLDDDEKSTINQIDSAIGGPARVIVNESGLYHVLMRSDKPEAKKFRRWVTHEVLPQIRKTGSYELVQTENTPAGWLPAGKHMSAYDALELTQRSMERTARIYAVVKDDLSPETRHEIAEYLIRVPVGLTKAQGDLDRKLTGTENTIGLRKYLEEKGVPQRQIKQWVGNFGSRVHALYKETYGREAPIGQKALGAAGRAGKIYVEKDRFIIDAVFQEFVLLGRFTPRQMTRE